MSVNTKANKVPEFVYANNGAKYHPCLYCCRAFAHKRYLSLHMKACIRTHLNEDDHKPSVSVFPPNYKKEGEVPGGSGLDITLSDEITIEKRPKFQPKEIVITNTQGISYDSKEIDDPAGRNTKRTDSGDENGNMTDQIEVKSTTKATRKFSMENACKLCDEIFSSLDELIMHAKIEHNQRSKDNKKFSPEDIEYFLKVFTKMNKSHCPICRKAILNTLNWKGHLYTHCTVRKFVCKICGKWFTRGDHCKFHELRHKHGPQRKTEEK